MLLKTINPYHFENMMISYLSVRNILGDGSSEEHRSLLDDA